MRGIVCFMALCTCCACRYGSTAVEEALVLAGKNSGDLDAVLTRKGGKYGGRIRIGM